MERTKPGTPQHASPISGIVLCSLFVGSSPLAAQAELPVIGLEENLRFLVIDPAETAFPDVRAAAVAPDGSIYLGLYHLRTIRVFDADGDFLRGFGEVGSGPGEVRSINHLAWLGDTLYVTESRRAVFFGPDGAPRGEVDLGSAPSSADPRLERVLPEGRALFRRLVPSFIADADPVATQILLGNREADGLRSLVEVRYRPRPDPLRLERGERAFVWESPYRFDPLYDVAPDGSTVAVLERRQARGPEEAAYTLLVADGQTGEVLFERPYEYRPRAVDRETVHDALARGFAPLLEVDPEELLPEIQERLELPDFEPPVLGLAVGNEGTVWIEVWRTPGTPPIWHVLDREGTPMGAVQLPAGAEIVLLERDAVYVTEGDAGGLELVRYRLAEP